MRNKITAVLTAFICVLSLISPVFAASVSDFKDVSPNDWYYDVVTAVTNRGMFSGTSATSFSPDITMTRGMFVTVLGRYGGAPSVATDSSVAVLIKDSVNARSGPSVTGTTILACLSKGTRLNVLAELPDSSGEDFTWYKVSYNGSTAYIRSDMMELLKNTYTDVPADSYYAPYVQWACNYKIADTENGLFRPEEAIKREDICLMLCRFAELKHLQLEANVNLGSFTDSSDISKNCVSAVNTLRSLGVINGFTDGSFRPKGAATRAQVSAMLVRFIDAISYKPVIESPYDQNGNYVFGRETPQSTAVDKSYFSDACFIGHSITVGMKQYLGLDNADFYAVNGASCSYLLNTYNGFEISGTHTDENGNTVQNTGTLKQALSENSYKKVYIMLGTNDIGASQTYLNNFYTKLGQVISLVRSAQPDAIIYLFSVTPVTQSCSEARDGLNRDNIIDYNSVIKKLAAENSCYYLNVFDLLVNKDGFLPNDAAISDGIHILSAQYAKLKTYIFTHTVS